MVEVCYNLHASRGIWNNEPARCEREIAHRTLFGRYEQLFGLCQQLFDSKWETPADGWASELLALTMVDEWIPRTVPLPSSMEVEKMRKVMMRDWDQRIAVKMVKLFPDCEIPDN